MDFQSRPDGTELRIRRSGGKSKLTLKHGSGLVRTEEELKLLRERGPLAALRAVAMPGTRRPA